MAAVPGETQCQIDTRPRAAANPRFAAHRALTAPWVGLALVALCLLIYLPGLFALPPVDRDEARFAEASRTMADAADWSDLIVPRIQGTPRLNKPPLVYWLQAAAVRLTGHPTADAAGLPANGIFAYRLPSIASALVAVFATFLLGRRMFAGPVAALAALLLGTCLVVLFDARQARADELLLACTTVAQLALWHIWRNDRTRRLGWILLLWIAIAAGVLAKGPVTPAIVLLTALALSAWTRDWRWLRRTRPLLGLLILLALALPWVLAVGAAVGWQNFLAIASDEVLGRSLGAKEGHAGPPGYYLLLSPLLFWPGSLALIPALLRAVRRGLRLGQRGAEDTMECATARQPEHAGWLARLRSFWTARAAGRPAELFCLAWLIPGWVVFEIIATKLPHYTLPLFPALALLCARAICSPTIWNRLLARPLGRAALGGWLLLTILLALGVPAAVCSLGHWRPTPFDIAATAVLVAIALVSLAALVLALRRRRFLPAQLAALACAVSLQAALMQCVLPRLDALWISSRLQQQLARLDPHGARPLVAAGYQEDSLIFLTHGRVQRLDWDELADWLAAHPEGLAIVTDTDATRRLNAPALASLRGFNYSKGRWENVSIIAAQSVLAPQPASPPPASSRPASPPPR